MSNQDIEDSVSSNEVVKTHSKFRSPNGIYYLKALFFETSLMTERANAIYTLKDEDHEGLPSIRRLFVECGDPTEYTFATTYFGGWTHWKKLLECNWFKPIIEECREELRLKIAAEALLQVRALSVAGNPAVALQASKYLVEGTYIKKDDKRGRPSKEAIIKEANVLFLNKKDTDEDFSRILNG